MSFWIVAVSLSALVCLVLVFGAARQRGNRSAALKAMYDAQIAAVAQDHAKGLIDADEQSSQKVEIARRLLSESSAQQNTARHVALEWGSALAVPLVALAIYSKFGAPHLPDLPQEVRLAVAEQNNDIDAMVYRVEKHLASNPNDIQGWQVILPTYVSLQRYERAAVAYRQLIRLSPPSAELQAGLAEVLTEGNAGQVPPEAVEALALALRIDPKSPKARFFDAVNAAQRGEAGEGIKRFEALLVDSPADAPWRVAVLRRIQDLKAPSARPPALTEEQMAAAQGMEAGDQMEMIRGMVDGLATKLEQDPNNLEGWLRLIRARTVLRDMPAAEQALATARKTFNGNASALNDLNGLATELKLK